MSVSKRVNINKIKIDFIKNTALLIESANKFEKSGSAETPVHLVFDQHRGQYSCRGEQDQLYIMWLKSQNIDHVEALVEPARSHYITKTDKMDLGYVYLTRGTTLYKDRKTLSLVPSDVKTRIVTTQPLKLLFLVSEITDEMELIFGGQDLLQYHCSIVPESIGERCGLVCNIVDTLYSCDGWMGTGCEIRLLPRIQKTLAPESAQSLGSTPAGKSGPDVSPTAKSGPNISPVGSSFPSSSAASRTPQSGLGAAPAGYPSPAASQLEASIAAAEASDNAPIVAAGASLSIGPHVRLDVRSLSRKVDQKYAEIFGTQEHYKPESVFVILMKEIDPTALVKMWFNRQ